MSKAEIIAELAHLSREDLAEVRAWLDRIALPPNGKPTSTAHIRTPKLADRAAAGDFRKQVTELPTDAAI